MIAIYQTALALFVLFVIFVVVKAMLKTFLKDYLAVGIVKLCCGCLKSDQNSQQNNKNCDEKSRNYDKRKDEEAEKMPI